MKEVESIAKDIRARKLKPLYLLTGKEPFFIDQMVHLFEKELLNEVEKEFNYTVFYGKDVQTSDIVNVAKRFPIMSDYQLVIVKEAQDITRNLDFLLSYLQNPQPTTILVYAHKYKSLANSTKLYKAFDQNGVVVETKEFYERQVGTWIISTLAADGYQIEHKANQMLVAFLGKDLSKIYNELQKLQVILPKGTTINASHIETNIGISKDYNTFELKSAIIERNTHKAFQIAKYFGQHPKEMPLVIITNGLFQFFSNLLLYYALKDKSDANVAKELGLNIYTVKEYHLAAKNYKLKSVSTIIHHIRQLDIKGKGVGANALSTTDLLNETLVRIFSS